MKTLEITKMKKIMKTLFTTLILVVAMQCNAQYYPWLGHQYGVTNMNELNQKQLNMVWESGDKLSYVGKNLTIGSGTAVVIGSIVYFVGLNQITSGTNYSDITGGLNVSYAGIIIFGIGSTVLAVSIPLWYVGNQRKQIAKLYLSKYDQTTLLGMNYTLNF